MYDETLRYLMHDKYHVNSYACQLSTKLLPQVLIQVNSLTFNW